jgi:hypothetical protein
MTRRLASARGWRWHQLRNRTRCTACRHPRWQHLGVVGTACTHLGRCPCAHFQTTTTTAEETPS